MVLLYDTTMYNDSRRMNRIKINGNIYDYTQIEEAVPEVG